MLNKKIKSILVIIVALIASNTCYSQFDSWDAQRVLDGSTDWFHASFDRSDLTVVAKNYHKFVEFIERVNLDEVPYSKIVRLYQFTEYYSRATGQDQTIPRLNKAYKLLEAIKEYMGSEIFKKVPLQEFYVFIDEIYRSLDINHLTKVSVGGLSDQSIKKLLIDGGFAEHCIKRDNPRNWKNGSSARMFRYADQAKAMLGIYNKYDKNKNNIEPSLWLIKTWEDIRYINYRNRDIKQPGRGTPWDFNSVLSELDRIYEEPVQSDVDLFLGRLMERNRRRGMADVIVGMSELIRQDSRAIVLVDKAIKAGQSLVKANSNGSVNIFSSDLESVKDYISRYEVIKMQLRTSIPNSNRAYYSRSEYYSNGKIKRVENYHYERLQNRQFFYESGNKKRQENYNKETGLIEHLIERSESNRITKEETYDEFGKPQKSICYHPNGAVKEKIEWANGVATISNYDEYGKLYQTISEVENNPNYNTIVQEHNTDGTLVGSSVYYNGKEPAFPFEVKKPLISELSTVAEIDAVSFMEKMDVYISNLVERDAVINDADIKFILGAENENLAFEPGALATLLLIYSDPKVDESIRVEAYNCAIIMMSLGYIESNKIALGRDRGLLIVNTAVKLDIINTSPSRLVYAMDNKKIKTEVQIKAMEAYGRLISDTYMVRLKK